MLCGVGGSTVAQAKETITVDELNRWVAYRNAHGPLDIGRRLERSVGMLCWLVASAAGVKKSGGGNFTPDDFMPHEKRQQGEADDNMSFAEFISSLGN